MVVCATAGGNNEQITRQRNNERVDWKGKMEYLVVLALILVIIARILGDKEN